MGQGGEMCAFDTSDNLIIELAYKTKSEAVIGTRGVKYRIDTNAMTQQSSASGVVRKVERVDYAEMARSLAGM